MLEIDLKISQIRPTVTTTSETITKPPDPPKAETNQPATNAPKERPAKEKPKNKAEERLQTIREQVLKAMERLAEDVGGGAPRATARKDKGRRKTEDHGRKGHQHNTNDGLQSGNTNLRAPE